jgi:acyl carrier protein
MMIDEILALLDRTLGLEGRSLAFTASTPLIGAVPELDSIGVVSIITALEEQFGFSIDDDEIDGDIFKTVGSLVAFASGKLAGA